MAREDEDVHDNLFHLDRMGRATLDEMTSTSSCSSSDKTVTISGVDKEDRAFRSGVGKEDGASQRLDDYAQENTLPLNYQCAPH